MTNLNDSPSLGPVDESELDRTLRAHFPPRRHSGDPADFVETVPVAPIWQRRSGGLAACRGDNCRQGRDKCPTPDGCRLPVEDADSDFVVIQAYVYVVGAWVVVLALLVWYWSWAA